MDSTFSPMIPQDEQASIESILRAAHEAYGDGLVLTTSFGAEDQILTDAIARHGLGIDIVTLDTGRLFEETYALWAETEQRYGLRIRAYVPDQAQLEQLLATQGTEGHKSSIEARRACCRVRKLTALERALQGRTGWICGLRREQSPTRAQLGILEQDPERGLVKISPLAWWHEQDLWNYIRAYDVPYNPLHDQGYPSIGCACCTRAIKRTESIRTGRWWWEQPSHKECGLHNRPRH